ncbi:hypothetical protein QF047_004144 [Arthrobacter sp. W4I7]|nr:hypothetical protein [Arthrobacter sp. W4I7]
MAQVLSGAFPFDEVTMDEDHGHEGPPEGVRGTRGARTGEAVGAAAPRKEEDACWVDALEDD